MDLYQLYSLFSFLVRSNAGCHPRTETGEVGGKEKAKTSALRLQICATFCARVAHGQWRFGRYAFLLKAQSIFPDDFVQSCLFGMSSLHASTLVPLNTKAALWEGHFSGIKPKPNKANLCFLLKR